MKNLKNLSLITIVFITFLFVFSSCGEDSTPPNIYLLGADGNITQDSDTTILLYSNFIDPGIEVEDNVSALADIITTTDVADILTFTSDGFVRRTGVFDITYSATDEAGNIATETKEITVGNISDPFAGIYSLSRTATHVAETTYNATVGVDTGIAGRVSFPKVYAQEIGGETSSYKIYADLFSENLASPFHSRFGYLGLTSDPETPFFEDLTYEEATDSILSFTLLKIDAQTVTDALGNEALIAGREENSLPLSRIEYLDGTKEISRIVLELNVTIGGVVDSNVIEIYTLQ